MPKKLFIGALRLRDALTPGEDWVRRDVQAAVAPRPLLAPPLTSSPLADVRTTRSQTNWTIVFSLALASDPPASSLDPPGLRTLSLLSEMSHVLKGERGEGKTRSGWLALCSPPTLMREAHQSIWFRPAWTESCLDPSWTASSASEPQPLTQPPLHLPPPTPRPLSCFLALCSCMCLSFCL